jgi:hypothetical protein
MFDFSQVKDTPKLKFVGYGINAPVVVCDVTNGETASSTPFIQINVKFQEETDDSKSTTLKLYMSPKAQDISMKKIMHMHQAINKLDVLKSLKSNDLASLAASLKAMWINRPFRLKLSAEEYVGTDMQTGEPKTKIKLNIPFAPFAEAMTPNAEFKSIMNDSDSALTFDKSNKYDYKPLDAASIPTQSSGGFTPPAVTGSEDNVPF